MKTTVGFMLCIVAFCFVPILRSSAQDKNVLHDKFLERMYTPRIPDQRSFNRTTPYRIPGKRASHYTPEEWGKVIDSTWGPGQGAAAQLNIFDTFWSAIDQQWAGFPNLPYNWDSLRTLYRPQIGSGLSRGRFYALMSRMWLGLCELHSVVDDQKVESSFGLSSFKYRSGVPLILIGTRLGSLLGAAVTPLPDSTNLVYRVAPGNPLGLVPGDLVLGYEGVPWKRLYRQLLDAGVPVSAPIGAPYSWTGSSLESVSHLFLMSVCLNWGLFDTIDVVKFSTGDTLHLPTALLDTTVQTVWSSDQVPVSGVPMPDAPLVSTAVSWGIVQGTNVGYIYVWDWYASSTPQLFSNAISDLRHNHNVEGLVLDFRFNYGGYPEYANGGFSQLFNFDPTSNMSVALRNSPTDRMSFSFSPTWFQFTPSANPFDRPIAMLIGPGCQSAGDHNAFRMRFHPMVRSFGKPTNGGFHAGTYAGGSFSDAWFDEFPRDVVYSKAPGEGFLIHKGVLPDEEVWLTREGAAKGEDDVVKRALSWMSTLTYAHDVTMDHYYGRPGVDSLTVTAVLANPLHHQSALSGVVTDYGLVHDSVLFYNDGLHGDGVAGDSIWGTRFLAPAAEGTYSVSVETQDITQGTSRRLPDVDLLTTAGPLVLTSVDYLDHRDAGYCEVLPYVKNVGSTAPFIRGTISLSCSDSGVYNVVPARRTFSTLAAGATGQTDNSFTINYAPDKVNGSFILNFTVGLDGHACWDTTFKLVLTGVTAAENAQPTTYALEQNYPNPFNPTTGIRYQVPGVSNVRLSVFDLLGREVAVLVNERKAPGSYEVKFDASGLASGMYLYRLSAGSFVQTRKMIVVK